MSAAYSTFNMSCVRSIKSFKNWAEKGLDPEENGLSDSELVWCAQTRFRPKS